MPTAPRLDRPIPWRGCGPALRQAGSKRRGCDLGWRRRRRHSAAEPVGARVLPPGPSGVWIVALGRRTQRNDFAWHCRRPLVSYRPAPPGQGGMGVDRDPAVDLGRVQPRVAAPGPHSARRVGPPAAQVLRAGAAACRCLARAARTRTVRRSAPGCPHGTGARTRLRRGPVSLSSPRPPPPARSSGAVRLRCLAGPSQLAAPHSALAPIQGHRPCDPSAKQQVAEPPGGQQAPGSPDRSANRRRSAAANPVRVIAIVMQAPNHHGSKPRRIPPSRSRSCLAQGRRPLA